MNNFSTARLSQLAAAADLDGDDLLVRQRGDGPAASFSVAALKGWLDANGPAGGAADAALGALEQIIEIASGSPDAPSVINKARKPVASQGALAALDPGDMLDGDVVGTLGARARGDFGGADYEWNAASTDTADGALVIQPDVGGAGRWVAKVGQEVIDARVLGMNPGRDQAENSAQMQLALNRSQGRKLVFPFQGGVVEFADPVTLYPAGVNNPNNLGYYVEGLGSNGSAGTILKYTGTVTPFLSFNGGYAGGDNRPIWLKKMCIRGPDTGAPGTDLINLTLANGQTLLEDLLVYGAGRDNISLTDAFGATLNRIVSNNPRRDGIRVIDAGNNLVLDHVRSFGAGRSFAEAFSANIRIGGALVSYGPDIRDCDVSYAGNRAAGFAIGAGLVSITVVSNTATALFDVPHGLTNGQFFGIIGGDTVWIGGTGVVGGATTYDFTFYSQAANGTYSNAELAIVPSATGLSLANVLGGRVAGFYAEDCPQSAYFNNVHGMSMHGGENLSGLINLETNCSNLQIGGINHHGINSGISFYGTGQHDVDISETNYFDAGARVVLGSTTVRKADGNYSHAAPPTAGAWRAGARVRNNAPPLAGGVTQWVCPTAGTPGAWRADQWVTAKGATGARPTLTANDAGVGYLDTTLAAAGKPITWTGTVWVDATGVVV